MAESKSACIFCDIVSGKTKADIVFDDAHSLAFLDHRPLFPGHCLLIPKEHFETLVDLPDQLVGPFFTNAGRLTAAIERACHAEGTFVAINNKVSQSVPHLHVHIVPRKKGDGLKGFFWPRHRYGSQEELQSIAEAIRRTLASS